MVKSKICVKIYTMEYKLQKAVNKLAEEFSNLNWSYTIQNLNGQEVKVQNWLGSDDENIMVCILKDLQILENFHRQDYFFINYAYKNSYIAKSYKFNNEITISENECYIGQPFSGYAIKTMHSIDPFIVGVLIKKELFYREFLQVISNEPDIFKFFIATQTNKFSEEFLHFSFDKKSVFKTILDLMIMEYAFKKEDSQIILKSYTADLLLQISRRYRELNPNVSNLKLSDKILSYMASHPDVTSLKDVSRHFSYHPNYISALLKQETGKTFKQHILKFRMERALMLLKGTPLTIEEIAEMTGYNDSSNFYKAFKYFYGVQPRNFKF